MRVIAGKARRLNLKTVPGDHTRPTTDRIKETLFNILQPDLPGCRFLDLFAGSGGIGIEALSRGARSAVFVDNHPKAAACIRDNLSTTRLADQAQVLMCDAAGALARLSGRGAFDIIFMDPPYRMDLEKKMLTLLAGSDLVDEDTMIIVEAALDTPFDYLDELGYELTRRKEYKTNAHMFIRKKESNASAAEDAKEDDMV